MHRAYLIRKDIQVLIQRTSTIHKARKKIFTNGAMVDGDQRIHMDGALSRKRTYDAPEDGLSHTNTQTYKQTNKRTFLTDLAPWAKITGNLSHPLGGGWEWLKSTSLLVLIIAYQRIRSTSVTGGKLSCLS